MLSNIEIRLGNGKYPRLSYGIAPTSCPEFCIEELATIQICHAPGLGLRKTSYSITRPGSTPIPLAIQITLPQADAPL